MIITVKAVSEELKENGDPKHIEWTAVGADGKDIALKIYPAIQVDGQWLHFEDRWDEFRNAHNKSYDIERANIKVEKGYWKPVIKATEVKDVFVQKAQKEVEDKSVIERQRSISLSYAVQLCTASKIEVTEITKWANTFTGFVFGSPSEPVQSKSDSVKGEVKGQVPIDSNWVVQSLKKLEGTKGWEKANVASYLNTLTGKENKSLLTAWNNLSETQKQDFATKIKDALSKLKELEELEF